MQTQDLHYGMAFLDLHENWANDTALDDIFHSIIESYEATTEYSDGDADIELTDTSTIVPEVTSSKSSPTSGSDFDFDAAKPARKRIRTYTARKNEIDELLKELPHLESYVDFLKHQTSADVQNDVNSLHNKRLVNSCLREKVHQQQFLLARMQASMTLYMSKQQKTMPFDTFIHLRKDQQQRVDTLLTLKPRILCNAKRFVMERSAYMDLSVSCRDQTSFVTPDGDYCALWFCVIPLPNVTSAKPVFDKLLAYLSTLEVMVTQATGDLMVHEACDEEVKASSDRGTIAHCRNVRTMPNGLDVESNLVLFSQYEPLCTEYGDGRDYGVVACVAVDKDDRYPYTPNRRLRYDMTSVWTIKTIKRKVMTEKKKEEDRIEVVMTRASFFMLHHTEMDVPKDQMLAVRDRLLQSGDIVCNAVRATFT